jgi:hypothetical protein
MEVFEFAIYSRIAAAEGDRSCNWCILLGARPVFVPRGAINQAMGVMDVTFDGALRDPLLQAPLEILSADSIPRYNIHYFIYAPHFQF